MRLPRFVSLLIFVTFPLALSACKATPQPTEMTTPIVEMTTPIPEPTLPEEQPTEEPVEELPRSEYYDQVTLLETANLPLTRGDDIYVIRSSVMHDMNNDGVDDAVFTVATYPDNIFHPIVILDGAGPVANIADQVFPDGVPTIVHSNQIFFIDVNADGLKDLLISEAGSDHPPWFDPDALIGIGLNRGGGIFEDVSNTVPDAAKGLRNYSLTAGDLYNDGVVRIVLPSQAITGEDPNYTGPEKTGLLFWNGDEFEFKQNWINMRVWWWPENLYIASFMAVRDIDSDGYQDLFLTGNWTTPNYRILYGSESFPWGSPLAELPEGPYGHTSWETYQLPEVDLARGADVNRSVIEDFDGDGDLDIVSVLEEVLNYKPGVFDDRDYPWYNDVYTNGGAVYANIWLQVLRNDGERQFVDVEGQGRDLGRRYYISLDPIDLDLDGDLDLLGTYWSKQWLEQCVPRWGSTFFINEGGMTFVTVEASDVFPELEAQVEPMRLWPGCDTLGLGVLYPTAIQEQGMQALFVVPIDSSTTRHELRVFRFEANGVFHLPEQGG